METESTLSQTMTSTRGYDKTLLTGANCTACRLTASIFTTVIKGSKLCSFSRLYFSPHTLVEQLCTKS